MNNLFDQMLQEIEPYADTPKPFDNFKEHIKVCVKEYGAISRFEDEYDGDDLTNRKYYYENGKLAFDFDASRFGLENLNAILT